ncbi:hypothetical protein COV81_05710 [Candidatus Peregrinibacteria bacterium CG11_big_fil_rev_8_21_14_0_20_41_10]|nr:MAG: hypothetical protein COV81_05710 [Candidatus Peregrinibacteria bacterium CG11_big_fil_rev_8_21_14_0_20_41_10]PIZ76766.1 MAG: hypothetical protein COY06_01470 [Candidatus Peregrinibacteria bacterium CG_4_10_14_0_2_um_filter_41_8]PJC37969.1 MAG: hypothetical protein CO045_02640 [Candidatus Peregrinibacteria bacterium CG_4_9_14_0_2_um_filter_41_14]
MSKSENDVKAFSDSELGKEIIKTESELYELGISIRSNQSNDLKNYHNLKKRRARLKTEQSARRIQKEAA